MIRVNINGHEIDAHKGQTVLDVARSHNIDIPTLCHDERVKIYGSCGLCVVEIEGSPRLFRACATEIADGMVIKTDTKKIRSSRKTALELLQSDHTGDCVAPCRLACPGDTDCQGYVGLIANGEYSEALKLIKDKIPLPASIGRVCPHPCEDACRRQLVEEPVSIAALKSFAADMDLRADAYIPEVASDTNKTIAIIGGGASGLSAAYFLRQHGHEVVVMDAMPKMGGMLRYGIPEYRLPKNVLDNEIEIIQKMGIKLMNGVKVGRDITLLYLRKSYDCVVVAIGAWSSIPLGCKGEDMEGVIGGIDFLREAALTKPCQITGRRVAVVGGGNVAMDACRTAVRLGASQVYNIYRRTRDEMPAEDIEITEAEEEGVIFKYLTNPLEISGEGRVNCIRLQKMELGEPDASGRRAPVAIPDAEELLDVDVVIIAIGQTINIDGFEGLERTRRGFIAADETTFRTSMSNVFAIGEAKNKGPGIAIAAIGDAKAAAVTINGFLEGRETAYVKPFLVTRDDITEKNFEDEPKIPREKLRHLSPSDRRSNFKEINEGYTEETARKEAWRCLTCGCHDYHECKLLRYSQDYDVKPEKYMGKKHDHPQDNDHPFIIRNQSKCILCGLCVRVCDEVMGRSAFGLVSRGFDTVVVPEMKRPLHETDCISCGQCVTLCPTGALMEKIPFKKAVPLHEDETDTVCSFCGVGCATKVTAKGSSLLRSLPEVNADGTQGLLCVKGRFGLSEYDRITRLNAPLLRKNGKQDAASYYDAFMHVAKRAQSVLQRGKSLAVAVSDKLTNEEIFTVKKYAELIEAPVYSFGAKPSGLAHVLGVDASLNTFKELDATDVILLVGEDVFSSHTIAAIRVKAAAENAKLISVSKTATAMDEYAVKSVHTEDIGFIKAVVKAAIQKRGDNNIIEGYNALRESLDAVSIDEDAAEVARIFSESKKAVIVFDQNSVSVEAAELLAALAVVTGHIGNARDGIIQLKKNVNSQGLCDMGVCTNGMELREKIRSGEVTGLLVFGEDVADDTLADLSSLDFLMVADTSLTPTARCAEVVLPLRALPESEGTVTSSEGRVQTVKCAVVATQGTISNIELIKGLANVSEEHLKYKSTGDVFAEIKKDIYTEGKLPVAYTTARLTPASGEALFETGANTNAVYRGFMEYLGCWQNR